MEKKSCIRCKKEKGIDEFDEGRKSCKQCLEHKRVYYKNVTTKDYIYIVWFATREETQHSGMIILKNKNTKKGPLNN